MAPGTGLNALELAKFTWLLRKFRRQRGEHVQDNTPSTGRSKIISAQGIDLDSIEDMMNRRLRNIWVRHTWFVVLLGTALFIGLVGVSVFFSVKPTIYASRSVRPAATTCASSRNSRARLQNEHATVRVQPLVQSGAVHSR